MILSKCPVEYEGGVHVSAIVACGKNALPQLIILASPKLFRFIKQSDLLVY
jgi:hypothetical protein